MPTVESDNPEGCVICRQHIVFHKSTIFLYSNPPYNQKYYCRKIIYNDKVKLVSLALARLFTEAQ